MANPQKEDGYTPISNEIIEALMKINLSPYETRILWFLFRKTYGWQKKIDWITISQFVQGVGLDRRLVHRTIKKLHKKNIVVIYRDDNNHIRYGFQKDYSKWKVSSKEMTVIGRDDMVSSKQTTGVIRTDDNVSSEQMTGVIHIDDEVSSKQIPTKETNTKETNTKETNTKETITKEKNKNFVGVNTPTSMNCASPPSKDDLSDQKDDLLPQENTLTPLDKKKTKPPNPPKEPSNGHCPHDKIIALYHKILPMLPKVRVWPEVNKKILRARWREDPERQCLDWWQSYFEYVRASPFLIGQETDWAANLEWLVRPRNITKVLNGSYHKKKYSGIQAWMDEMKAKIGNQEEGGDLEWISQVFKSSQQS